MHWKTRSTLNITGKQTLPDKGDSWSKFKEHLQPDQDLTLACHGWCCKILVRSGHERLYQITSDLYTCMSFWCVYKNKRSTYSILRPPYQAIDLTLPSTKTPWSPTLLKALHIDPSKYYLYGWYIFSHQECSSLIRWGVREVRSLLVHSNIHWLSPHWFTLSFTGVDTTSAKIRA